MPPTASLSTLVEVLAASAYRLAALIDPLSPEEIRQQAYPSQWSVADVLSHIGSGAIITQRRLDGEVDAQSIWDEWNAKDPDAQAADALQADRELQARLALLTADDQSRLRFAMGPMELDLSTFLGLRVNEHSVHTWDIAVTFDDTATIPPDATALVLGTLEMMAGFAGKPTGDDRTITVRTHAPEDHVAVALRPDGVSLTNAAPAEHPDLEMTAEALVRLVYGRLDPHHSADIGGSLADLDLLREVFPGF